MKLPLLSSIGNFFPKLQPQSEKASAESRPFRAVQIEVTSRCNTGCVFCPHDALSDHWVDGDISLDLYSECIVPHLGLFELVYLQGWGEPLLHPDLWDMLSMAQEKGCRTGFTTNGTWLESEQNERLLDMGVDMISVSFAGTVASVHESLRTNSKFPMLCQNFESLANLKKQRGSDRPWLELHFLMTRANLGEFSSLVELAASLGADEVVATNLTYSPNLALDRMHVFGEQPLSEDVELITQAKQTAEKLNIPLRIYPLRAEPQTLICDADPVNTVYINHRGEVSPCVYLGLTVQGQVPRFYQGKAHPFNTLSFGNVCTGFEQALQSGEREAFTAAFKRRNVGSSPLAMFTYLSAQSEEGELPPPPAPCQHCYKMLGV
ncbi:MAG: radical SAM protein [Anaerolineales bacterium]|nr:radical SAM protein [Anaerolineales bacterium]